MQSWSLNVTTINTSLHRRSWRATRHLSRRCDQRQTRSTGLQLQKRKAWLLSSPNDEQKRVISARRSWGTPCRLTATDPKSEKGLRVCCVQRFASQDLQDFSGWTR